jgi:hypothetical protein
MKIMYSLFIFCLVLFIYLHIQFHLKTSNDLEIYETDEITKDRFEEICDVRQPVVFNFDNQQIIETTNKDFILKNCPTFEVKIRNIRENDENSELYVPLLLQSANKLFINDKTGSYFSENNSDFLQESNIIKHMKSNDGFLRPYMMSNSNYDIILGSQNCCTPFRYEVNYRNFFLVTQGSVQIKLAPPQSIKYLKPVYDYENFEFKSDIDIWNPQEQDKTDFNKVKCLEFNLVAGKTIYIPAFWWYSIKVNKDASISCFRYRTYMNNLAILPYVGMYALQNQNVKRNVAKKLDVNTDALLNEKEKEKEEKKEGLKEGKEEENKEKEKEKEEKKENKNEKKKKNK